MMGKWDDINRKESHENKPLIKHIGEVLENLSKFLKFYEFSEESFRVGEYIAEYHDMGKLSINWNIHKSRKPPHSPLSIKWLIDNKKVFEGDRSLTLILWYLILKHHSALTKQASSEYQLLPEEAYNIVKKLSYEDRINIVDLFGLFKIADTCSAKNVKYEFERPKITEEAVRQIVNKPLDGRWEEQVKLKSLESPALLRAPTGWGKTDVSLLFFVNKNVKKVFYLLPTVTAINAFFNKLKNALNGKVSKYFYFYDTEIKEDLDLLQNLFFAEHFLNPFIVTTVDQLLLSFLQTGKYYMKRVMFRDAGIILDEVHLLNPLMLNLLTFFLKKFKDVYNYKILFMSATLPNSFKEYFENSGLQITSFLDFSGHYKEKRRVQFEFINSDIEEAELEIADEFKKGKRVLVVVNTVEKAIKLARKLRGPLGEDIVLLHARFMYKHRKEKEDKIDKFKNRPHVLIATQVCEVSLDISYDVMFTEMAPLSSLIQRFGRVNRVGSIVKETNVKIFNPDIKDEGRYPYPREELEIARKAIERLEGGKLSSELDLLLELNEEYTLEKLNELVEGEAKKVNLKEFEEKLQFFFSLDVSEKELAQLLDYRDSFTTLIIPHPECIEDPEVKAEVEGLIREVREDFRGKSFNEQRQLFAGFKEVTVPIPIWWMKGKDLEERAFPIVDLKDKVYKKFYGFINVESEII